MWQVLILVCALNAPVCDEDHAFYHTRAPQESSLGLCEEALKYLDITVPQPTEFQDRLVCVPAGDPL